MKKRQQLWQSAACLGCAILAWRYSNPLEGTEFSGGTVTGPMLVLHDTGVYLLPSAMLLAWAFPRASAAMGLIASALCLPLYLYFAALGPFRAVFRGEYSVPMQASFVWDKWAMAGMLVLAVLACLCLRGLFASGGDHARLRVQE